MSEAAERSAWADYWQGAAGMRPACLPKSAGGVEAAQRGVWAGFAGDLPRGARVLDIGTGDGAVLMHLKAARQDLQLTGVDLAPSLPPAPPGIKLIPRVAAEALPFKDRRFDAVVSQFGFEYAEVEGAVREVARVLAPGGQMRLLVHHRDGPILAHNLMRRESLALAIAPGGLLERARALTAARRVAPLPTPPAFRTAGEEFRTRFPGAAAGEEFALAIWQTLEGGRSRPPGEVSAMLDLLERKARGEMVRIDSLARAARDEAGIAALCDLLGQIGIAMDTPQPQFEANVASPYAWLLGGRKAAQA